MDLTPDIPGTTVRRFVELDREEDDDGIELLLRRARTRGAALLPELSAALAYAHELPPPEQEEVQAAVTEIASAARAPELLELVVRDLPRRPDPSGDERLDAAVDADPEEWAEAALRVRAEALDAQDDALADACAELLARAPPGTPGVLDALLADVVGGPDAGPAIRKVCRHDDPRAAEAVLSWARAQPAADDLEDDDTALDLYGALRAVLDWGVPLGEDDLDRADAALARAREAFELMAEALEDELDEVRETLDDLRPLRPAVALRPGGTGFGSAAPGSVARNAPCPCGSGRKAKKCCH